MLLKTGVKAILLRKNSIFSEKTKFTKKPRKVLSKSGLKFCTKQQISFKLTKDNILVDILLTFEHFSFVRINYFFTIIWHLIYCRLIIDFKSFQKKNIIVYYTLLIRSSSSSLGSKAPAYYRKRTLEAKNPI